MAKNDGPTAELDPRALILEAYRIDGIGAQDCRTIYFDWAIGSPAERDMVADTRALLLYYETEAPDHPMTSVLREGLATPRRRRGRSGRG
ncbi:MAG: hypothetical protein AAF401_03335 [Pseudomonadota bacterium]